MRIQFVKYKSFFRFVIAGCINTGVDFIVFTLLSFLGVDKLIAQTCAYTAGLINSFILNKKWTFGTKKTNAKIEFMKFLPVNLVSLCVTLIGIELLNGMLGINVYIAKLFVTIIAQLINYFGYKTWVFGKRLN